MLSTEKEHIRTLIEAKKLRIARLASQIHQFTRIREAEISKLAALQMRISPIGHLPIELLAEIFDLHVPGESFSQDSPLDDTPAIVEAALRVSQVCRHWRQTAHSTPRLWVDGFRLAIDQEPTELDFAQTSAWLERSQPLPITVYVFRGSNDPLTGSLKRTRIFKALLSAAGRWKHLVWDIPFLSPLLDIVSGTLVALETFAIEDIRVQPAERILDIFMTAPRLRGVSIKGGRHPGLPFSSFLMPWNQLTTLKLQSTGSLNECRQIMLQCTNLVTVTLYSLCGWDFSEGSPSSPIVVLPFLEDIQISFTLEEEGFSRIEPFFAPLALPALKTLKIEAGMPANFPSSRIGHRISRS
ncbi:hypothetical protein DFH09DRAFT_1364498 [Mycena vulgaris]|nr:hypothetical protein DFH09DRAFT_1364498 [Mycena vulgaris]